MPPETITGVSATARRPSSTLTLVISKKFPHVKKAGAIAENNSVSAAITTSSTHSPFGNHRRRHIIALCTCAGRAADGAPVDRQADSLGGDRDQDDRPLNRALTVRADAEKRQRRTDRRKQD